MCTIYLSPNSAELQGEYREGGKFRGVTDRQHFDS